MCPRWRAVVARREEKKHGREDSGRSHLKAMTVTRLTAKECDDQQQYQSGKSPVSEPGVVRAKSEALQ